MRSHLLLTLTSLVWLGFTAGGRADVPLQLSDPGLPLQEVRPLDRRVYILTLEGKWKQLPLPGKSYYVRIEFPDGSSSVHRVMDEDAFRQGEVRCVIQGYQLSRHGLSNGGKLQIAVLMDRSTPAGQATEVVSNPLEISWPMDRPIVLNQPRTRFSTPQAVDTFALPGEPRPPERLVPPTPRGPGPKPGSTPPPAPAPGTSGGTGTTPGAPAGAPPAVPPAPGKAPEPRER